MCIRKMPSRKNNKRNRETPLLQMDPATFQAAVMAAVTAAMAQINANNPNGGRNSIDNSFAYLLFNGKPERSFD